MWQNTYNLKTWSVHNLHLITHGNASCATLSKRGGACALVVFALAKQPSALNTRRFQLTAVLTRVESASRSSTIK